MPDRFPKLAAPAWDAVQPEDVITALVAAGWEKLGGRQGMYVRLRAPFWPHENTIVPLDPSFADYRDDMTAALTALTVEVDAGRRALAVLADLGAQHPSVVDTIRAVLDDYLTVWSFTHATNDDFAHAIELALRTAGHLPPTAPGVSVIDPIAETLYQAWWNGTWRDVTEQMTPPGREAAVAAVIRVDDRRRLAGATYPRPTRERLAWWDD